MPSDEAIDRLREKVSGDEEIETTFRRLRQDGHSRLEAIRMILEVLDLSLAEAKELLARIGTWDEAWSAAGSKARSTEKNETSGGDNPVPPAPG
jgi:ribosomal protein L7/L12